MLGGPAISRTAFTTSRCHAYLNVSWPWLCSVWYYQISLLDERPTFSTEQEIFFAAIVRCCLRVFLLIQTYDTVATSWIKRNRDQAFAASFSSHPIDSFQSLNAAFVLVPFFPC